MGCSSSKIAASALQPTIVSLDLVKAHPTEENTPKSTRFLENCRVVWLTDDISDRYAEEQEHFRTFIYNLKIFNNIDGCIEFISNIQDEKVFLIISNHHHSIERFQYLSQLEKIYILTSNIDESTHIQHRKANHDIVESVDELYEKLQDDMKCCLRDMIPICVTSVPSEEISSISILTKQEASFLFSQMIKEIVHRLKFESRSKDVFIDFCRQNYSHHSLTLVEEMAKNYRPNKALSYLVNLCFVSQILHRALRTREIDLMYKLGFFIKQLNIQLNRLYEENVSVMKEISTVYRGKTMSNDEFDSLLKDRTGDLLTFPTILLTAIDKQVATNFLQRRLKIHSEQVSVLFEIEIDCKKFHEKTPFALLKDAEMNYDTVGFYMSTVCRIQSVEQIVIDTMTVWSVKLQLVNDDDPELRRLVNFTRTEEIHANPVLYLGKVLIDMGEYRRAELVLLGLTQDASVLSQPRRLKRTQSGLGAVYTYKNEYNKALYYYQQALQTSLTYLQSDHIDLVPLYKAIGDTYLSLNNYEDAIKNYETAIKILNNGTSQTNSELLDDINIRIKKAKESSTNTN